MPDGAFNGSRPRGQAAGLPRCGQRGPLAMCGIAVLGVSPPADVPTTAVLDVLHRRGPDIVRQHRVEVAPAVVFEFLGAVLVPIESCICRTYSIVSPANCLLQARSI